MDDLLSSMSMLNSSIQNVANSYLTADASKKDRQFAEKMYERQVEDARLNWQMQNEYNTPLAQMERLAKAGVNPAMYWSKGIGDSGNSAEPEPATPLSWNKRIPAGLSNINPFEQLHAILSAEKTRAEIKKLGSDTTKVDEDIIGTRIDNIRNKFETQLKLFYGEKQINEDLREQGARIQKLFSDALTADEQGTLFHIQGLLNGEELDQLKEKRPFIVELAKQMVNLKIEEIRTQKSEQSKNYASVSVSYKQVESIAQDITNGKIKNADDFISLLRKSLNIDDNAVNNAYRQAFGLADKVLKTRNVDEAIGGIYRMIGILADEDSFKTESSGYYVGSGYSIDKHKR